MVEPTIQNTMNLTEFNLLGNLEQAQQFAYKLGFEYLKFDGKGHYRLGVVNEMDYSQDRETNPYFINCKIYPPKKY